MPLDCDRIKVICFDIDGTLADTDDFMVEKLANLFAILSPFFPRSKRLRMARKFLMAIETPANRILHLLDKIGLDDRYYTLRPTLNPFQRRKIPSWKPIEGMIETLTCLAENYSLAIITVRDTPSTQSFIHHCGLSTLIQHWASAETTAHTKPDPDPIRWIASQLGVSPSECLMVGDTTVDILAGRNAASQTVGVLSGFGEEKELWEAGADEVIRDVNALCSLLKSKPAREANLGKDFCP